MPIVGAQGDSWGIGNLWFPSALTNSANNISWWLPAGGRNGVGWLSNPDEPLKPSVTPGTRIMEGPLGGWGLSVTCPT